MRSPHSASYLAHAPLDMVVIGNREEMNDLRAPIYVTDRDQGKEVVFRSMADAPTFIVHDKPPGAGEFYAANTADNETEATTIPDSETIMQIAVSKNVILTVPCTESTRAALQKNAVQCSGRVAMEHGLTRRCSNKRVPAKGCRTVLCHMHEDDTKSTTYVAYTATGKVSLK